MTEIAFGPGLTPSKMDPLKEVSDRVNEVLLPMTKNMDFTRASVSLSLVTGLVACTTPNLNRRPDACVAETDAEFCARIGATCDSVTRNDNCGTARTANCGTCGATDTCVASVCKAPVCSSLSFPRLTSIAALNDPSKQDTASGASADGKTVLWQRGSCAPPLQLLIGDSSGGAFVVTDLSAQPALAPLATDQDGALTLTANGLTIIGMSDNGAFFLQASRAAVGQTAFGPASNADFAALNVDYPTRLDFPTLSSDGLAFYFRRTNSSNPSDNGLYESVRTSPTMPFPPATKMSGAVQSYVAITGISSDRMTLFLEDNSARVFALTRKSLTDPFVNGSSPAPAPMLPGFHLRPLGDCQSVIATYSTGNCNSEELTLFSK